MSSKKEISSGNRKEFVFHFRRDQAVIPVIFYAEVLASKHIRFVINSDKSSPNPVTLIEEYDANDVNLFVKHLRGIQSNGLGIATLGSNYDWENNYSVGIEVAIKKTGGATLSWESKHPISEFQTFTVYIENQIESEFMLSDILCFVEDLESLIGASFK